jgi:hypothetical protein
MSYSFKDKVEYLTDAIKKVNKLKREIPMKFSDTEFCEIRDMLHEVNKKLSEKLAELV